MRACGIKRLRPILYGPPCMLQSRVKTLKRKIEPRGCIQVITVDGAKIKIQL